MDIGAIKTKVVSLFDKYKYILLILAAGVVLMVIPTGNSETTVKSQTDDYKLRESKAIHQELSELLSNVDGAGEVQVMLTVSQGQQTIFQEETSNASVQTVIITDADRNESGLIVQVNAPVYQGAIVLCQGADDPSVRLNITEAVSKVTGLGTNQIAILKMK